MNTTQRRYATERARGAYQARMRRLVDKSKPMPRSIQDKLEALRDGRFEIKHLAERSSSSYLDHHIVWPWDKADEENYQRFEVAKANLEDEYQRLKDELMMGEAVSLLERIRAFEDA